MSAILSTRRQNVIKKLRKEGWLKDAKSTPHRLLPTTTQYGNKRNQSESSLDEGNYSGHESDGEPKEKRQLASLNRKKRSLRHATTRPMKMRHATTLYRSALKNYGRRNATTAINSEYKRPALRRHIKWAKDNLVLAKDSFLLFSMVLVNYRQFCSESDVKPLKASVLSRIIQKCFSKVKVTSKKGCDKLSYINLRFISSTLNSKLETREDLDNIQEIKKVSYKIDSLELKSSDKENAGDSDDSGFDTCETDSEKLLNGSHDSKYIQQNIPGTQRDTCPPTDQSSQSYIIELPANIPEIPPGVGTTTSQAAVDTTIEVKKEVEELTPQQKISQVMFELLKVRGPASAQCSHDAEAVVGILCKMIENKMTSTFLAIFGHSVSCTQECNKLCFMFRRIRKHIQQDKNHTTCPILAVYGHILKLHVDFCITPNCGIKNCSALKQIRKQNVTQATKG